MRMRWRFGPPEMTFSPPWDPFLLLGLTCSTSAAVEGMERGNAPLGAAKSCRREETSCQTPIILCSPRGTQEVHGVDKIIKTLQQTLIPLDPPVDASLDKFHRLTFRNFQNLSWFWSNFRFNWSFCRKSDPDVSAAWEAFTTNTLSRKHFYHRNRFLFFQLLLHGPTWTRAFCLRITNQSLNWFQDERENPETN